MAGFCLIPRNLSSSHPKPESLTPQTEESIDVPNRSTNPNVKIQESLKKIPNGQKKEIKEELTTTGVTSEKVLVGTRDERTT